MFSSKKEKNVGNTHKKFSNAHTPSKVLSNDPIKLFLSDAPCNCSQAINCGHAESACSKVFKKHVRPKLCKPAIWPRLCRNRDAPVWARKYENQLSFRTNQLIEVWTFNISCVYLTTSNLKVPKKRMQPFLVQLQSLLLPSISSLLPCHAVSTLKFTCKFQCNTISHPL